MDHTHVMVDGRIVASGGSGLVEQINRSGYEQFVDLAKAQEAPAWQK